VAAVISLYFKTWPIGVGAFAFATIVSLFGGYAYDRQIEYTIARQVADPQLAGSFGAHHLTLSEAGLREVTPATDSLVRWDSVTDVVTEADHIFVRLVTGQAAIISRQSYAGPVAFDDIPRVIDEFKTKYAA